MIASVTRSACDAYTVRAERSWAVITLFPYGDGGGLGVLSDYGNWSHGWSHPGGQGFRRFLLDLDRSRDYLVGKLTTGRPKSFDCEATVARIKRWVEEDAHNLVPTGPGGRLWGVEDVEGVAGELEGVGSDWGHSADLFVSECLDSYLLARVVGRRLTDGVAVMVPDPACVGFVETLWPHFVAEIRKEVGGG